MRSSHALNNKSYLLRFISSFFLRKNFGRYDFAKIWVPTNWYQRNFESQLLLTYSNSIAFRLRQINLETFFNIVKHNSYCAPLARVSSTPEIQYIEVIGIVSETFNDLSIIYRCSTRSRDIKKLSPPFTFPNLLCIMFERIWNSRVIISQRARLL